MVGRHEELDALLGVLDSGENGRLAAALIEGEAGMGKTTLVEAALSRHRAPIEVFLARCEEWKSDRPFGAFLDAVGHHPRIARLVATRLGPESPSETQYRVIDEIVELFETTAMRRRVLLWLEDTHWADASTVLAARALTQRLLDLPVTIILTARPLPRPPEVERFIEGMKGEPFVLSIPLRPLDLDSISELASHTLNARPAENLLKALQSGGGNPFLVRGLLEELSQEGNLQVHGGVAEVGHSTSPPRISLSGVRALRLLSDPALDLLRLAAVLGTSFSVTDLAAVARRPVVELMPLIEEGLRSGLLTEEDVRLRFRHDLIHDALYHDIPASVRKALHLEVAGALRDATGLAEVAHHYKLGADVGDRDAVAALREMALSPSVAPDARVELLERALELCAERGEVFDDLSAALAEALIWGGRAVDGIALCWAILERSSNPDILSRVRPTLTRGLWLQADWDELWETTSNWIARPDLDDEERALLLGQRATAGSFCNRPVVEIVALAEQALALGERSDSAEAIVSALIALIYCRGDALGQLPEQIPLARRAVKVAEVSQRREVHRLQPRIFLGIALHSTSRFDEAEQVLREGLQKRERSGGAWDLAPYHLVLAQTYTKCGRWDDALVAAEASVAAAEESGTEFGLAIANSLLGEIAFYRDNLEESARYFEASKASAKVARSIDFPTTLFLLRAMAEHDTGAVVSEIRLSMVNPGELGLMVQERLLLDLVRFLVESGHGEVAEQAVLGFEEMVESRIDPQTTAHVAAGRAALEDDPNSYMKALEMLTAEGLWQRYCAAERLGDCLARRGQVRAARQFFALAIEGYDQLAAARLVARTHAAMRRAGLSVGKRGPRKRPQIGWAALTDAEWRIVALSAEGLTNRQIADRLFISRHTVQTHLKSVFAKLDIHSRVELAAIYARESSAPSPTRIREVTGSEARGT